MKRIVAIVFVLPVALVIFLIADSVSDFVSRPSDDQQHRLLLVAAICSASGVAVFGLCLLWQRFQRRTKLIALGSGGSLAILAGSYFAFCFARLTLPPVVNSAIVRYTILTGVASSILIAGLLWLEFYQVLRRRDRAT